MLKLVAIGNRFMMDDGVAIAVTEKLRNRLESLGFEVILAETDFLFCFHLLNANDFVIFVDAASIDGNPGSIHVLELQEAVSGYQRPGSQHEMSLFDLMRLYPKSLKGYLVCIEIAETGFGCELSGLLSGKLEDICLEIECVIHKIVKEQQNARYFSE